MFSALRIKAIFGFNLTDTTYTDTTSVTYSFLEAAIAIICASALVMRPVIERMVPKRFLAKLSALGSTQHGQHHVPNLRIDHQSEMIAGRRWYGESGIPNLDGAIDIKFGRHSEDIWPPTYRIDGNTTSENLIKPRTASRTDDQIWIPYLPTGLSDVG